MTVPNPSSPSEPDPEHRVVDLMEALEAAVADAKEARRLLALNERRPNVCPCADDLPDPCPACGASIDGGVCRAITNRAGL